MTTVQDLPVATVSTEVYKVDFNSHPYIILDLRGRNLDHPLYSTRQGAQDEVDRLNGLVAESDAAEVAAEQAKADRHYEEEAALHKAGLRDKKPRKPKPVTLRWSPPRRPYSVKPVTLLS